MSKLPDRCFCFDFAWLVTLNLHVFNLPIDGLHAVFLQEVVGLAEHLVSSAYGDKKQVYEYNEDEIKHMLDSITECEKILSDLSDNKEYQKLVKSNKKIYDKEVKLNKIIMELIRECYSNINTVDGLITEMFAAKWDNDSAYDEKIINELRKMLMKANLI